jgi:hypothetical protein
MTDTPEVNNPIGGDVRRGKKNGKGKRKKASKDKPGRGRPTKGSRAPSPRKRDNAELPPAVATKLGRPSKYDPSLCDLVIKLGALGKSKAQMAASIGIARSTFALWEQEYRAFSEAVKAAMDLSLSWWEEAGQLNMTRPGFNATAYIFQMKNRFSADYRDRQEQALDLSDPLRSLLSSIDGKTRGIPTGS